MSRKNSHERREQRRTEAQERAEAVSKLSPTARLARLDQALGEGLGAKKERARLTALLEKKEVTPSKKRKKGKKDDRTN